MEASRASDPPPPGRCHQCPTHTSRSFGLTSICSVGISGCPSAFSRPQKTPLPACMTATGWKNRGTTYQHPCLSLSMAGESGCKQPSRLSPQVGSPAARFPGISRGLRAPAHSGSWWSTRPFSAPPSLVAPPTHTSAPCASQINPECSHHCFWGCLQTPLRLFPAVMTTR